MFLEIAAASFLVGQYIYHRWIEDKPIKQEKPQELQIPIAEVGAVVPLIYGRTRVRSPVLAWVGKARSAVGSELNSSVDALRIYYMNMFFVIGIPFDGGQGTNNVHNMWAGDKKFSFLPPFAELPRRIDELGGVVEIFHGGGVEIVNGSPSLDFDSTDTRGYMISDSDPALTADQIPGYRGYLSIGLLPAGLGRWSVGESPNVPAYSFEVSSYHTNHSRLGTLCRVGNDSNPVNIVYDLLATKFGKLGISTDLIDMDNFQAVQYKLHTESFGLSGTVDRAGDADEVIQDILRHIDGVLRWNMQTQKIELKLVRNDFDPNTIPHITRYNGKKLSNFAAAGWSNLNNKLQLVYTNREKNYQDDHVGDDNQANASNLDIKNPLVLQYPYICSEELARAVAARELAARSRPIIKLRAIVDRSFLRVNVGDAVKLTWTNPDISGLVFRVANVEHGTLEDGAIALDLIQDFNYIYRGQAPRAPRDSFLPRPPGGFSIGG